MNLEKCHTWTSFRYDSERFPSRDWLSCYPPNKDNYCLKWCSLLAVCTKNLVKSSPDLQELWGVGRWLLPGCTPCSLCWITSKRWIYSVSDCSGSWGGTRDFPGAELGDGCNLQKRTNNFLLFMLYSQINPEVTFIQSGILWAKKTGTTTTPSICTAVPGNKSSSRHHLAYHGSTSDLSHH